MLRYSLAVFIFFFLFIPSCSDENHHKIFTEKEREWIEKNKSIMLALDDSNVPLNFKNTEGRFDGYNIELLIRIEEITKLKINLVGYTWAEALTKALNHEVDGIINIDSTFERSKNLLFTKGIFNDNKCLMCTDALISSKTLTNFSGKKIAVSRKTIHHDILLQLMPDSNIFPVNGIEEAFDLLDSKKIDCVFNDYSHLMYWAQKRKTANLKIAYTGKIQTETRIAIRNDKPIIVSILNRAINLISTEEKNNLLTKWIGKEVKY